MESFGERLRAFIKARYGSQSAFAKAVEMSDKQVSGYVRGARKPSAEALLRFYEAGASVDWLLTGHGDMDADSDKAPDAQIVGSIRIHGKVLTMAELAEILKEERTPPIDDETDETQGTESNAP